MINQMDEKYSTVMIMRYYRDMPVKDIARILNIPDGTVKSRLSKGREILKNEMLCEGKMYG